MPRCPTNLGRMDASEPSVDELVAILQARVAQRRAAGEYPADLEERLDAHYRRLVASGSPRAPELWSQLDTQIAALAQAAGRRSRRGKDDDDLAAMRAAITTLARVTRAAYEELQQGAA